MAGSALAKLFPTTAKYFLENASQEQVNAAEQEAAVIHQHLNNLGLPAATDSTTPITPAGAAAAPIITQQASGSGSTNAPTAEQITALTKRATDAEAKVTDLADKLKAAEADRDKYKAWYDKQANAGTKLPGADASNRGEQTPGDKQLSTASQSAMELFRSRKAA